MINGAIDPRPGTGDFRLEQGDAFVKFVDRKGIEILPGKLRQGVV